MPSKTMTRGSHPLVRDARPEFLSEALSPELLAPLTLGSSKLLWWKCRRKHEWKASPYDRIIAGHGCPHCSGRRPIVGESDLGTTHPKLAKQIRGVSATAVSAGSAKVVSWRCGRKHDWKASVANRALRGSGCPFCSGRRPIVGETDFATTEPQLALQVVDCDPTTFTRSSNRSVTWKCSKDHTYTATPNTRTNMRSGCPYCANRKTWPGFNDFATFFPLMADEAVSVDPTTVAPCAGKTVEWKCSLCLSHWNAAVKHRTKQGMDNVGCPACHNGGFKSNAPAFVYLLHRTKGGRDELKVGITCNLKTRSTYHRMRGWKMLSSSDTMMGHEALRIEQAFLRMLDAKGVPRGKGRGAAKEPGFTETWTAADYPVETVTDIINAITETRAA